MTETGTVVAENVGKILADAGDGVDDQLAAGPWVTAVLTDGGWTALTAAGSDADLTLRDLLELARLCGRSLVPHALMTTLLAGRWFGLAEPDLAGGVTVPVPRDGAAALLYAVPSGAGDTPRVVDGSGRVLGELTPGTRDAFSLVMPLETAPASTTPISGVALAEMHAVLAATATGCADAVLGRSLEWVQTRRQFGRTLAGFQALRHHLADMHVAREEAWTCAVAAGAEPTGAADWAWTALQRSKTVVETGIQVHGGVGFTWEAGLHHWLRHLLAMESVVERAPGVAVTATATATATAG